MSRCNRDDTGAVISGCVQYLGLDYFTNSVTACDFLELDVKLLYFVRYCAWYFKFAPSFSRSRTGGCFFFLFGVLIKKDVPGME